MSSILVLAAAVFGVVHAHHETLPGVCSWEDGGLGYCLNTVQGNCDISKSFVIPEVSAALVQSYCADRGYCCVEPTTGLSSRPPRGQTCEDIGKSTALGCNGPSLNWCRALKSATVSTPINGCDDCKTFADCQAECANTPSCDGFEYSVDPSQTNGKTCILIDESIPYYGSALELTPIDSLWVTWINSYQSTCEPTAPVWYDLNLALRAFTRDHEGFHAVAGHPTSVDATSDIASFVSQIIDNFYHYENGAVVKLQSSTPQQRQNYAAELEASIRDRLKKCHGSFTGIQWTTPDTTFASFMTYALVIQDTVYESMLVAALDFAEPASHKFKALALPSSAVRVFRDVGNQKVASFAAGVSCPEEGGCLGASTCVLNNGLCKCRSHYEVECVNTPQLVGCHMQVTFLATCGNPDVAWNEATWLYDVTGFGFTAYQEYNELGNQCQCEISTPK